MGIDQREALELGSISKTFAGTRALRDVSLEVFEGEVHALVGQNGSGKSTLVKILAGFHEPDPGGTVRVRGEHLSFGDAGSSRSVGLRFVHQDLGLVGAQDTVDNLALGYGYHTGRLRRVQWQRQSKEAKQALEELGHDFDVRVPVAELSAAERTAVAIARALQDWVGRVSLLVLDEPTAAMPLPEVERLFDLVKRVKARGTAVLYVSHHLGEVFRLADRVSVLRDGRLVASEPVKELTTPGLIHLMTGEHTDEPPVGGTQSSGRREEVMTIAGLSGRLLKDFDLQLCAGEVVGVAGITGSGREELCDLIFGGRPRRGTIQVETSPLESMRPDLSVELGIGLVPADRHGLGLVLSMSVRENLTLSRLSDFWRWFIFSDSAERRTVSSWISQLGIKTAGTEAKVSELSGGNQQKVVLSRWLRLEPRVLLLDAPTQGVDVAAKAEIHRLIDETARRGAAVLVCSSDEGELERLSDRVVVLRRGVMRAELKGSQATASRIVAESLIVDD